MTNNFTPTQQAMLDVLKDGLLHPRSELIACINDPEENANTFHQALFRFRQNLRSHSLTVTCEVRRFKFVYRLVQLVGKAAE